MEAEALVNTLRHTIADTEAKTLGDTLRALEARELVNAQADTKAKAETKALG